MESFANAEKYKLQRRHFLWQRLRLWFWLTLVCVFSFLIRDIYNFFSPLSELANVPSSLMRYSLLLNIAMLLSIIISLLIHRTKFGRRHPGVLFLGLSCSISLGQQIFSTLKGFAVPDIFLWSLLFLGQATFMPVRWTLHLLSQVVLLIYYFGVNTALGLKLPPPSSQEPIYNVTFLLYIFWFCVICDLSVYLYDRLQASEFSAQEQLEATYAKLQIAESKYRSIFENAAEGIYQSTPNGRYITANPAIAKILGFSTPAEVTSYFTDIGHQLYINPHRRAEFVRLIEEFGSVSEFESQIYRSDGSIVWVAEKAYAVRDRQSGDILYYEGMIEDITQRKRAEEALQEQFTFLQVLIDTIPAPVFYQNAKGLYVGCNQAFETSLGLSKTQIIGKTVYQIAPQDLAEQYHQADVALFEKRGVQTYEGSVLYADGKKHDVIFYKATFAKADGTVSGLVGVILDISERKRTEEALRVFFHAVSHDLRNPVLGTLMVLRNLMEIKGVGSREWGVGEIQEGGNKGDKAETENILVPSTSPPSPSSPTPYSLLPTPSFSIPVPRSILERMIQSSERQLNLINSLMEAHVSEVQGIALQLEPVQLYAIVEDALADLKPTLRENQATLINLVKPDLPQVNGDSIQLWRVFSNLIANAVKHNPPGLNITINATVEDNNKIYCTVIDNGVGMTKQQCASLFDLYFRGGNVRNSLSLGLGLYLCKQIIKAHGGEIGVKSSPNLGSTFWFTLSTIT